MVDVWNKEALTWLKRKETKDAWKAGIDLQVEVPTYIFPVPKYG